MSTAPAPVGPPLDQLPFRDPALPLGGRVGDPLSRLTADERIAMPHPYGPGIRLGVAPFRTGAEALHRVANTQQNHGEPR